MRPAAVYSAAQVAYSPALFNGCHLLSRCFIISHGGSSNGLLAHVPQVPTRAYEVSEGSLDGAYARSDYGRDCLIHTSIVRVVARGVLRPLPLNPSLTHSSHPVRLRPTHRGAGAVQGVKAECATVRTTLTPWGRDCSALPGSKADGMGAYDARHAPAGTRERRPVHLGV